MTATAFSGQALFQSQRAAQLLIKTLLGYRDQKKYQLHEFVIMPNHLHVLLTPPWDVSLGRAMQFIKGGYSYRARKELGISGEIWQRGYVDHRLRNVQDYFSHREYIHLNPVRRHLIDAAEDYPFSSAHSGFNLDAMPQGLKPLS